jgi:hypothetical protein
MGTVELDVYLLFHVYLSSIVPFVIQNILAVTLACVICSDMVVTLSGSGHRVTEILAKTWKEESEPLTLATLAVFLFSRPCRETTYSALLQHRHKRDRVSSAELVILL